MKKLIIIITLLLIPTMAHAGWQCFATKHTVVYYQANADLEKLNKKLKLGEHSFLGLFPAGDPRPVKDILKDKLDYIFEDVQGQLDMYNCKSIRIRIYTNQKELNRIFYGHTFQDDDCTAFYYHKLKTVYISLERVTEGVLAHEFAHAILDHYFVIRPPTVVAELLAQHVDKHLNRRGYHAKP